MDITELIDACREAAGRDTPTRDVSELVAAFVHQPNLSRLLGDGDRSTYEALYRGEDILVLHGVVPPTPAPVAPHDHRMWAVIGVYQGLERNELFVRAESGGLESVDSFTVGTGDVRILDPATIHSVQALAIVTLVRSTSTAAISSGRHAARGETMSSTRWTNGTTRLLRRASSPRDRTRTRDESQAGRDLSRRAKRTQLTAGVTIEPAPGSAHSTLHPYRRIARAPSCCASDARDERGLPPLVGAIETELKMRPIKRRPDRSSLRLHRRPWA